MSFYQTLKANVPNLVGVRPEISSQATLEIYLNSNDPNLIQAILENFISPEGARNGFAKVLFYTPAINGGAEEYRLDSEVTLDNQNSWHVFKK